MKKLIALALLAGAGFALGGYGGTPSGPYTIEIFADDHEGYVYYSSPVNEIHVTLAEPGEAWVHTKRINRYGVVVHEAKERMVNEGDSKSFAFSYSPAIVYAVEYTGRANYYRADRH